MNLYLISQTINNDYDTYSDAVVAAEDELRAKQIHPCGQIWGEGWRSDLRHSWFDWAKTPEEVQIQLIGTAIDGTKEGVICASYHAG
jgi:hypothetical protein